MISVQRTLSEPRGTETFSGAQVRPTQTAPGRQQGPRQQIKVFYPQRQRDSFCLTRLQKLSLSNPALLPQKPQAAVCHLTNRTFRRVAPNFAHPKMPAHLHGTVRAAVPSCSPHPNATSPRSWSPCPVCFQRASQSYVHPAPENTTTLQGTLAGQ